MNLLPALLLLLSSPAPAAAAEPQIRVAIARNTGSLKLKTSSKIYVEEVKTGQKFMLLPDALYEVRPGGRGVTVAEQELSSPVKLLASEGGERIRLGAHLYKGDILLLANREGKLDIIECLPLEDYLYGVLPVEMSPDWPLEALKAQAVASRTYALRYLNPARDYDVTNGVEMQVYNGTTKVNGRIMEAVNSTRGKVLKYKGKLVNTFFHANCGGHTASARSAWGEEVVRPLYGVADAFCSPSRHYRWEYFVSSHDLLKLAQSRGSTGLKLKGFSLHKKDRSGRAVSFKIATDRDTKLVQATDFRKHFGTFEFKSTLITRISQVKGGYELAGRGWGHGVGMCQDGAKYMANKGRGYKRILSHYYPGAALTSYD